jgi:hypothetical protein
MTSDFIQLVKKNFFEQNNNIKWVLIVDGQEDELKSILDNVNCGIYQKQFTHISDTKAWYSTAGGHPNVIGHYLQKALGHDNFILLETAHVPIVIRSGP